MNAAHILRTIGELPRRNTAAIRQLRRTISVELSGAERGAVVSLALDLVQSGDSNGRWVGYEIVQHHGAARDGLRAGEIEQLGAGIDSWGAVDCFACFISGPAWREGRISDSRIHGWARSADRWWRRAALVSTVPLNVRAQGGRGDAARTLAACELLVDDRDDMVVKALSWALRALAVRDATAVRHFLKRYDDRLAALVKREVRNKLSTGRKNR